MLEQVISAFEALPLFFYVSVALLSLMVGSFLNVVVYRLPKMLEREWYTQCREFLADEVKDIPEKKLIDLGFSVEIKIKGDMGAAMKLQSIL